MTKASAITAGHRVEDRREASAKSWGMSSTTLASAPLACAGASPAPLPWLIASAISSAAAFGTPWVLGVDSRFDLFSRIRTVPSTAMPRLEPKLRTVCVIPVASP